MLPTLMTDVQEPLRFVDDSLPTVPSRCARAAGCYERPGPWSVFKPCAGRITSHGAYTLERPQGVPKREAIFWSAEILVRERAFVTIGICAGLSLHHGLFIKGEWHLQAPKVAAFHVSLFTFFLIGQSYSVDSSYHYLFKGLVWAACSYVATILSSIVLYRVFFHRLTAAGFDGPWCARVSKLWHVWAVRHSTNHLVLDELHKQYGDFVRTGPAEVTVFHPDIFMAVDGPRADSYKAEWYDVLHPHLALVTCRDKSAHGPRRREWNRGFTSQARSLHNARILKNLDELDQCIEDDVKAGRPSNMRDLLYWFSFDAMGDFVFSKSFRMLRDRKWHSVIARLQVAMSLLGPLTPAPWLIHIGFRMPRVSVLKDWYNMLDWCASEMRTRLDTSDERQSKDLAHYLMELDVQDQDDKGHAWLTGDSVFAIVAGAEPTTMTLFGVFTELAKQPNHATKIYEELQGVEVDDIKALTHLPHLNAFINESLRLYTSAPTGGARKTTEKGLSVAGRYIPPHTTIFAPKFSIMRREDCFERALEFIPERWTTKPELLHNAAAWVPFGTGRHSCLGRFLATDTVRFVTARMVKKYHIRFADGETGSRVMGELKDQFTACPGGLSLCFDIR
ncbi:cytochrome P450 [Xylariaceae sp. FL0016]|nr:cytochrome P450 [Xylariaceae sp. FL0016]